MTSLGPNGLKKESCCDRRSTLSTLKQSLFPALIGAIFSQTTAYTFLSYPLLGLGAGSAAVSLFPQKSKLRKWKMLTEADESRSLTLIALLFALLLSRFLPLLSFSTGVICGGLAALKAEQEARG